MYFINRNDLFFFILDELLLLKDNDVFNVRI